MSRIARSGPNPPYLVVRGVAKFAGKTVDAEDVIAERYTPDAALRDAVRYAKEDSIYLHIRRDGVAWADVSPSGQITYADVTDVKKVRR